MTAFEFVDRPSGRGFRGKNRASRWGPAEIRNYALAKQQSETVRKNPGGLVFWPLKFSVLKPSFLAEAERLRTMTAGCCFAGPAHQIALRRI